MLHNLILATTKEVFAGEIVNGRLNPTRLSNATTAYRIQSRTLRIPNRAGFFSSGPPRLQVHEATCFVLVVCCVSFSHISSGLLSLVLKLQGRPNSVYLLAFIWSFAVVQIFLSWFVVCHDRRRAPGYEWRDWELWKD